MALMVIPTLLAAQNKAKGDISGILTDGHEVLPGAPVLLQDTKYTTLTDMDGHFSLFNIPAGKYVLLIKYLGYAEHRDTITVEDGKTLELKRIKLATNVVNLGTVDVKGDLQRGSESKAINMVKTSNRVIDVISAEGISKLPDMTAAECVQRMPGVAIQRDKGEGAYVSLRGTPIDWTATLVNGDRMPVADEDNVTRSFEFEVLPSDLVDYAIISKSVTPDIEGDNIGGSINFITKTAVDERTLHINVGGGWNFLAEKPAVNANILWGDRTKNKRFSYVANVSYWGRYYGAQAYKVIYGSNFNQSLNQLQLKDYHGMRNTVGVNLAGEYQVAEHSKISAKFMYGNMTDDKYQNKLTYAYADDNGSGVKEQTIHGLLQRQIFTGELNGDFELTDKLNLNVKAASYANSFQYGDVPFANGDPRNGYFNVEFGRIFYGNTGFTDLDTVDLHGNKATSANGGAPAKLIGSDNPYGHGDNPKNIQPTFNTTIKQSDLKFLQAISEINRTHENDPIVGQANLTYSINNSVKLKFGVKFRDKEGSRFISNYTWKQNDSLYSKALPMTNFQTSPFDYRGGFLRELGNPYAGKFFPFLTSGQLNSFVKQLGDTLRPYANTPLNPLYVYYIGSSYHYTEMASAGYAMVEAKVGKVNLVGGLRVEATNFEEFADTLGKTQQYDTVGKKLYAYYPAIEQKASGTYVAVLPSLNVTYAVNDKMNLRFAFSRSFHRPNFAEIKPGFAQFSLENLVYSFGNPNLKPTYAENFDLAYEYFWGNKGMFEIGGYYKYVTDHIFSTAIADSSDPASGIIIQSYQNARTSHVAGVEASFVRKFDFLPKFLSGFGVSANFTYSWSQMQVPGRTGTQPMAEQTPIIYNVALFYEKYGFSARLGLNYTGAYLLELNTAAVVGLGVLHNNSDYDIFMGQNYAMDFLVSYEFKKHYTVYAEMNNLLDSPYTTYRGVSTRPIITEYYRQRGQIGFKFRL